MGTTSSWPIRSITLGAALTAIISISNTVQATETIQLTAVDGYPPKSMWVKEFINFFIPEIDRRLAKTGNYKIKWNQAWSGQITKKKKVLQGIQKGLGDIGVVTTVFHADRVPLQMIAYATPFVTNDPGLVARTVDDLVKKYPAFKQAWKKYNQVYLTNLAVFDSYQIFSKEKISSFADFKGKKINGAGMNLRYLQGLGAAGVGGSSVKYYNNMKTGVVDGAMLWAEGAVTFKLPEVAPHMLRANIGSANSKAVTMNADTWARLPEEVKTVISEAAISYRDHVSRIASEKSAEAYANFEKMGGMIHPMNQSDREKWANTMPSVGSDWAMSLEKKGLPGKAILSSYMEAMRTAEQPIIRQWDKE
ncbi:MAG: C4-dicarboxylate TRAP transporter substrate-binding protein [Sneathiella sp.]|nr:C4-dicarboxylate TRAP transporter substrate-binding protein [Sneathiella sp.]